MSTYIVHRGYSGERFSGDRLLVCPHCYRKQDSVVSDYCVKGRPDNSKDDCIHCGKVFGVIVESGIYYVLKLYGKDDNIC